MLPPVTDKHGSCRYLWHSEIKEWYEDQLGPWNLEGCPFTREERYEAALIDYYPKVCNVCGDWMMVLRLNRTRKCINQWKVHPRPGHWTRQPAAIPMGCTEGVYVPAFDLPKVRRKTVYERQDDGSFIPTKRKRKASV